MDHAGEMSEDVGRQCGSGAATKSDLDVLARTVVEDFRALAGARV